MNILILEILLKGCSKGMGLRPLALGRSTKGSLTMECIMDMGNLLSRMVVFMREILKRGKWMEEGAIDGLMGLYMREI